MSKGVVYDSRRFRNRARGSDSFRPITVASLRSDGGGNILVQGGHFPVDWVVTLSVESVVRFRGIETRSCLCCLGDTAIPYPPYEDTIAGRRSDHAIEGGLQVPGGGHAL